MTPNTENVQFLPARHSLWLLSLYWFLTKIFIKFVYSSKTLHNPKDINLYILKCDNITLAWTLTDSWIDVGNKLIWNIQVYLQSKYLQPLGWHRGDKVGCMVPRLKISRVIQKVLQIEYLLFFLHQSGGPNLRSEPTLKLWIKKRLDIS